VPGFNQLSYGNSEYDARHTLPRRLRLSRSLFPAWKQHYLVNQAIGGWHLTGITTLQSGNPVSIGESGFNRSLWCNGAEPYSFYECPDNAYDLHLQHLPHEPPRGEQSLVRSDHLLAGTPRHLRRCEAELLLGPGFN